LRTIVRSLPVAPSSEVPCKPATAQGIRAPERRAFVCRSRLYSLYPPEKDFCMLFFRLLPVWTFLRRLQRCYLKTIVWFRSLRAWSLVEELHIYYYGGPTFPNLTFRPLWEKCFDTCKKKMVSLNL
jgi:hypothetical protein